MNPRKGNLGLRRSQATLRAKGYATYLSLLTSVLRFHSNEYSFLRPLLSSLENGDFKLLYSQADSLSSQLYEDAASHFAANQVALLIKKFPWPREVLDLRPEENAIASFRASERRCGLLNRKFSFLSTHPVRDRFQTERGTAKYWIRSVIGSTPNYSAAFEMADFGNGASIGVHGDATNVARKISATEWTVTAGSLAHAFGAMLANYHLYEALCPRGGDGRFVSYDTVEAQKAFMSRVRVVKHNKISFVPKTAKTMRSIAVEPLLNGFAQKGVDQLLRRKLLRYGLDLRDQGRNQRLAREGSTNDSDDGFVTIDLKSASDSISIEIVRYLLPDDWFRALARLRSPEYELAGTHHVFNKFCSMGNGFCFPLQTLIFASACVAVGAGQPYTDFIVYGDDIILRKRHAPALLLLLKHWGFKVNTDKTFLYGPFRESCGTDWFGGEDVRPYTLDHPLDSLQDCFKFLNLTRTRVRSESFFRPFRHIVLNAIPERYRFFRPLPGNPETGIDSYGDEFLHASSSRYSSRALRWEWLELKSRPIYDWEVISALQDKPWLVCVALRGAQSVPNGPYTGSPGVTLRNKTQTKVAWESYASTSNWLPGPART